MTRDEQVQTVLELLAVYHDGPLPDDQATRALDFAELGLSSLTLATIIVELEDRLDRELDFEAFAGMATVGDLLVAVGLG